MLDMNLKPKLYRGAATAVTYGRLAGTGIVVGDMLAAKPEARRSYKRATSFALLSLLDGVDGWLARKSGQTTPGGAKLDQEADKAILYATEGGMALATRSPLPLINVAVCGLRDNFVNKKRSELREQGLDAKARRLGKIKTTVQFAAVAADASPLGEKFPRTVQGLRLVGTALSVASGIEFIKAANQELAKATEITDAQVYTMPEPFEANGSNPPQSEDLFVPQPAVQRSLS